MDSYQQHALFFKALADANRLMIVDMLSCGELCACEILERFKITQPTLSHHMKTLCECGLVRARKDGKWMRYSLDEDMVSDMRSFLQLVTSAKEDCICTREEVSFVKAVKESCECE